MQLYDIRERRVFLNKVRPLMRWSRLSRSRINFKRVLESAAHRRRSVKKKNFGLRSNRASRSPFNPYFVSNALTRTLYIRDTVAYNVHGRAKYDVRFRGSGCISLEARVNEDRFIDD